MNRLRSFMAALLVAVTALQVAAATFTGDRTDFRDETIYFAMTTRFYDGDPKNNVLCWDNQAEQERTKDPCWRGDFKGLIDKLDYIKALGFTAIWITPVVQNASGYDYHGYHAMDFSRVDCRYESHKSQGSAEDVDFQTLINKAHEKGIKIILDVVLQHTGNFGEENLQKLFTRNYNIRNQADINACMIPDTEKLGADYLQNENLQYGRRLEWMKNIGGVNKDSKNHWHHVANAWNWDDNSRWWGQIAGDCVDLNTENPAVYDYIVKCYGKFIEMGVDGFRIDTSGHISRLTFNSAFIPQFQALGEKYKKNRPGEAPFFMFGEVCARFNGVVYRGDHALSGHFYTWKSPENLVNEFKATTADWWAKQTVPEGAPILGNMVTCTKDVNFSESSDNALMKNGAYHEPDYSKWSGFSVIDFPMHYSFNNVGQVWNDIVKDDKYYNDATYNVVYVDSHDYAPGPNDDKRFTGGTAQWAENLSFMFTFRGIPCLYYGSEVEFMKGAPIDKGPNGPLSATGRAYFGAYLEGNVHADDFGVYTADGQVAKTLDGDLAHHIRRLNQIRAAVPALRKGQYTKEGCSGTYAYKRAWKDSYALVCVNGGATFSNVPAGTYVDLVTGKSYTPSNGTITVTAPSTQGQLRVLVKGWTGGKVGEDGKFIYDTNPKAHGGSVTATDPGASFWYNKSNAVGSASVQLSPAGGTFKTETLTVNVSLNDEAVSGWYKVGSQAKVDLSRGAAKSFTIGAGMKYGESVTVTWEAKGEDGSTFTGSATYRKVDPNAALTIYVSAPSAPHLYAWVGDKPINGEWPGKQMSATTEIEGTTYYYHSFDGYESVNIIFNNGGGAQTANIENVTSDTYYKYDGGSGCEVVDINNPNPNPGPGPNPGPLPGGENTVYFDPTGSGWNEVYAYAWNPGDVKLLGAWPGTKMTACTFSGINGYSIDVEGSTSETQIIFNNGSGAQTADLKYVANGVYKHDGSMYVGVDEVWNESHEIVEYYTLQGVRVDNPTQGIYIVRRGNKVGKVVIR